MKKERNKKKLTAKQAVKISLSISIVFFVYAFLIGISLDFSKEDFIIHWSATILGTLVIFIFCYLFIFNVPSKKE